MLRVVFGLVILCSCTGGDSGMLIAHLGRGDQAGFAAVREAFAARNPGYDLDYVTNTRDLPETGDSRNEGSRP